MNNITFGDEGCGYYETVAGGAGAVSPKQHFIFLMFFKRVSPDLEAIFFPLFPGCTVY